MHYCKLCTGNQNYKDKKYMSVQIILLNAKLKFYCFIDEALNFLVISIIKLVNNKTDVYSSTDECIMYLT